MHGAWSMGPCGARCLEGGRHVNHRTIVLPPYCKTFLPKQRQKQSKSEEEEEEEEAEEEEEEAINRQTYPSSNTHS
jgi:hypothetical protein